MAYLSTEPVSYLLKSLVILTLCSESIIKLVSIVPILRQGKSFNNEVGKSKLSRVDTS